MQQLAPIAVECEVLTRASPLMPSHDLLATHLQCTGDITITNDTPTTPSYTLVDLNLEGLNQSRHFNLINTGVNSLSS
jgi:hypothetical protein